jgi:hypothetical protein
MELSDEKVLESLLRDWEKQTLNQKPARVRAPAELPPTIYEAPARKSMSRRCRCGACYQCRENARWERIFQAKFADPDYYSRRSVPHISPLTDA